MFDENTMKLDFEDFQELLSRPPPEKKEGAFNRNVKQNDSEKHQQEGEEENGSGF